MKVLRKIFSLLLIIGILFQPVIWAADRSPYKDNAVPGEIYVADFDNGDSGVTYMVTGNRVSSYDYRSGYGINVYQAGDDGVTIAVLRDEWFLYTVNALKEASYDIYVRYATPNKSCECTLTIDGEVKVTGELPPTGGHGIKETVKIGSVRFTKGMHEIKLQNTGSGTVTFNKIITEETPLISGDFVRKSGPYKNHTLPSVIEAEDYDISGCISDDGKNSSGKYRKDGVLDIIEYGKNDYMLSLEKGEEAKYTFNVNKSGAYKITAAVETDSKVEIGFDSHERYIPFTTKVNEYTAVYVASVYFEAGTHTVKVRTTDKANIDYFRFLNTDGEYITPESLDDEKGESEENVWRAVYVSNNADESAATGEREHPFKTIEAARDYVKTISDEMKGDIAVYIYPDTYNVCETIKFDSSDSGKNGYKIIYKSVSNALKPVINGGTRVDGWKKSESSPLWFAKTDIKDARTLYINNLPAKRSRSKYKYTAGELFRDGEKQGFRISRRNFPEGLMHGEYTELVWDILWTCQRTPVEAIEYTDDEVLFYMDMPYWEWAYTKDSARTYPYTGKMFYIENSYELLDEPGEFYFDKQSGTFYYYPFENEDMTSAEVFAGTCEFLVSAQGSGTDDRLENIEFDGIVFKYGTWNDESRTGVLSIQGDKIVNDPLSGRSIHGGIMLPAQFTVNYAKNLNIKNCEFIALGSGGISMKDGVSDSSVTGSLFLDISGAALSIGSWDHLTSDEDEELRARNILIENNVIKRASWEFRGSCGISAYYVNNVRILHNNISDVPYTGISLGWGWGEKIYGCSDNEIAFNKIENVCMKSIDGAHIYTLGPMRNTVIHDNYLTKSYDFRGGIYFDQGSSYIKAYDNAIERVENWLMVNMPEVTLSVDNTYTATSSVKTSGSGICKVTNTHVGTLSQFPEAVKIMNASGVDKKYNYLNDRAKYPDWRFNFILDVPTKLFSSSYDHTVEFESYNAVKRNGTGTPVKYGDGLASGGYVLGSTAPGDVLEYKLEIEKEGTYALKMSLANAWSAEEIPSRISIYLDDEVLVDNALVASTGSWSKHIDNDYGEFYIKPGTYIVTVKIIDKEFSLDAMNFTYIGSRGDDLNEPDFSEGVIVYEDELKGFSDIKGHFAEDAITYLADNKIVNGVSKTSFEPERNVTLYEACIMVLRGTDVKYNENNWMKLAEKYEMLKRGESDMVITRERFCDILMKGCKNMSGEYKVIVSDEKLFTDDNNISSDFLAAVNGAKFLGIVKGYEDGSFRPKNELTRAETAYMLYALVKK